MMRTIGVQRVETPRKPIFTLRANFVRQGIHNGLP